MMTPCRGRSLPALLIAALAALAAPARADVIVVDPFGGGDEVDLFVAVANASSGDILILRPHDYFGFFEALVIEGKALVIVGDASGTSTLPPLIVRDVPAGGTFVLRHLSFKSTTITGPPIDAAVTFEDCAGNVHIEDCAFEGKQSVDAFGFAIPCLPALSLSGNTGAVAIHRSTMTGGIGMGTHPFPNPFTTPSSGCPAIVADGGRLALYDVTAIGGKGGDGLLIPAPGAAGGNGITSTASELILSGATLTGGDGGGGTSTGTGGYGLSLTGAASTLRELDSTLTGGSGAPPLDFGGSEHVLFPGQAWQLVLSAPVRSGESGSLSVSGPPNCLFGLFISASMGYQVIGKFKGPFLPGAPFFGPQYIAATHASGQFNASFVAPSLVPFGLEGMLNVDQALMVQPGNGLVLGSATSYIQYETVH